MVRRFFEGYPRYFIRIQTLTSGVYQVREIHVRSTTERIALRTPANFFTFMKDREPRITFNSWGAKTVNPEAIKIPYIYVT